jgi:hypothetical protein
MNSQGIHNLFQRYPSLTAWLPTTPFSPFLLIDKCPASPALEGVEASLSIKTLLRNRPHFK